MMVVLVLAYVANQGLWRNRGGERVCASEASTTITCQIDFKPPAARNNFLDFPFQFNAKDKSAKGKDFL
jgi:hypothetical protein